MAFADDCPSSICFFPSFLEKKNNYSAFRECSESPQVGIFSEMKDNIIYLFHPSINPETSWENRFCSTLFFQDKVLIHIKRQSWKKGYWIFCSFFRTSSPSAAVLGFGNKNNFLSLVDSYTYPNLFIKATPLCVLSQICSCCRAGLHNSLVDYD